MNRWRIILRFLIMGIIIRVSENTLCADTRVAVVVGNQSYKDSPLDNPKNDATDMNAVLKQLGFGTTLLIDANADAIKRAVIALSNELQQGDATVGLFFYAGHGVQVDGKNYLIPLGPSFQTKSDIIQHGIEASWVLDTIQATKNKITIVILDACRDYPFTDGTKADKQGFAQMAGKAGALIAYSTAPGNIAKDGIGPNSPYTKNLKTFIAKKDTTIEDVFKNVRKKVGEETNDEQLPWELSALTSDYYPAGRSLSPPPNREDANKDNRASQAPTIVNRIINPPSLAIKLDFSEAKEEGIGIVENTLAEEFRLRRHKILDRSSKEKALLIKGNFQITRSHGPPPYDAIAVSHADISARVVRDGEIIASANVPVGKAFDRTGEVALEAAAHMLAVKLLDSIDGSKQK